MQYMLLFPRVSVTVVVKLCETDKRKVIESLTSHDRSDAVGPIPLPA
jgi:hypothetical protein